MIIISGYTKNQGLSDERLQKLTNVIKEKSLEKNVNVVVEVNVVTKEDKEEAKENDVSLGKLKVIKMILE